MNIMTTIGNFLIYSARSPENNPNININNLFLISFPIRQHENMYFQDSEKCKTVV